MTARNLYGTLAVFSRYAFILLTTLTLVLGGMACSHGAYTPEDRKLDHDVSLQAIDIFREEVAKNKGYGPARLAAIERIKKLERVSDASLSPDGITIIIRFKSGAVNGFTTHSNPDATL